MSKELDQDLKSLMTLLLQKADEGVITDLGTGQSASTEQLLSAMSNTTSPAIREFAGEVSKAWKKPVSGPLQ